MEVSKIRDGLWRWVVPHPAWRPEFDRADGWGRSVASVYAEYDEAVVLIDPLVPADPVDHDRFWHALDRDVARLARPVLVLVGCVEHGRSADAVAARYRAAGREIRVVGDAAIRDRVSCVLHATFEEVSLPAGLQALPIPGMSPGERAFVLDPWRAAVFADAVIGAGAGRVRVAPPSWGVKTPQGQETYARDFRRSLRGLLELRPEILLPSHGEPVITAGTEALNEALASPPWGDSGSVP
jgi:glyoxylase-like metal-dependent hydrolase (beta-lactamase superfamily II)